MTEQLELSVRRMNMLTGDGSLKALCDLEIAGAFLIKGLRVVDGKKGLFVSMPRQQGKDSRWFDSVEALTKEAKAEVERLVLEAYREQTSSSAL